VGEAANIFKFGGAYRIRTDDLFHAMRLGNSQIDRVTEVRLVSQYRRRVWLVGVVAVNLDVKPGDMQL
jgi:hypothetical protein